MNVDVILTNIDRRLKALGLSADEASRRAKKPDAIRNMKAGKTHSPRTETLAALARVLETTLDDLTRPPNGPSNAPPGSLRAILLEQRALIDRQLAELDYRETTGPQGRKRKIR